MSRDELKGTRLTPRAVGPGVFEEHLRGMQRGAVREGAPATQPVAEPTFRFTPVGTPVAPIDLSPRGPSTRPATQPATLPSTEIRLPDRSQR